MPSAQSGFATLFGLRGKVPKPPPKIDIDLDRIIADTIRGNEGNLPAAKSWADAVNETLQNQFVEYMNRQFPGYTEGQTQIGQNINAELRGEVPADVQRQLRDAAAARGVSVYGGAGTKRGEYDYLRNFGLTSLDQTQRGLANSLAWLSGPKAPFYNFTSLFLSPEFRANFEFQQAQVNTGIQWLQNQLKALPSKGEQAGAQILDFVASFASTAAGAGLGSVGGFGGGGGGGAGWGALTSGPGSSNNPQYQPTGVIGGAGYSPNFYGLGPQ